MSWFEGPRPRLFAHRGCSGTHPENTLEAFRAGLEAGADRLELDVHCSFDGHVVVFHDDDLDRTTDGHGPIRGRTLAELKKLDAGYHFVDEHGERPFRGCGVRIPTLVEVFEAFADTPLNIEVKQHGDDMVTAFYAAVDQCGARGRVLSAAYEAPIMEALRAAAPDVPSSLSAEEVADFVGRCLSDSLEGYQAPGRALQVPPAHEGIEIVTPTFVRAAHDFGMEVHVWTINDEDEMERLLDLGIDGLMSDYPELARAVLEKRGMRS